MPPLNNSHGVERTVPSTLMFGRESASTPITFAPSVGVAPRQLPGQPLDERRLDAQPALPIRNHVDNLVTLAQASASTSRLSPTPRDLDPALTSSTRETEPTDSSASAIEVRTRKARAKNGEGARALSELPDSPFRARTR